MFKRPYLLHFLSLLLFCNSAYAAGGSLECRGSGLNVLKILSVELDIDQEHLKQRSDELGISAQQYRGEVSIIDKLAIRVKVRACSSAIKSMISTDSGLSTPSVNLVALRYRMLVGDIKWDWQPFEGHYFSSLPSLDSDVVEAEIYMTIPYTVILGALNDSEHSYEEIVENVHKGVSVEVYQGLGEEKILSNKFFPGLCHHFFGHGDIVFLERSTKKNTPFPMYYQSPISTGIQVFSPYKEYQDSFSVYMDLTLAGDEFEGSGEESWNGNFNEQCAFITPTAEILYVKNIDETEKIEKDMVVGRAVPWINKTKITFHSIQKREDVKRRAEKEQEMLEVYGLDARSYIAHATIIHELSHVLAWVRDEEETIEIEELPEFIQNFLTESMPSNCAAKLEDWVVDGFSYGEKSEPGCMAAAHLPASEESIMSYGLYLEGRFNVPSCAMLARKFSKTPLTWEEALDACCKMNDTIKPSKAISGSRLCQNKS